MLVETFSVAAVFWFMFAIAVALFLAVAAFVPESTLRDSPRPDWAGGLLLTTALLSLLLAISQGNTWGWGSAAVVTLIVLSAALLAGFVLVERAASAPLVDMRLLAQRSAWSANLVSFAMGFAVFIAGVVVPQIARLPDGVRLWTRPDARRVRASPPYRARWRPSSAAGRAAGWWG